MKEEKILKYTTRACFLLLIIFMFLISVKFVARNVLYEKMGIEGKFISWLLGGEVTADPNSNKVNIDWETPYPHSLEINSDNKINSIIRFDIENEFINNLKSKLEYYASNILFNQDHLDKMVSKYENLIGWKFVGTNNNAIVMKNGYLMYTTPLHKEEEIIEIADSISDFQDHLSKKKIPFLFVNFASKVCQYDNQLFPHSQTYVNENCNALLAKLSDRNVYTIDFREEIHNEKLDHYNIFYKEDSHWKIETGFWAAGILANYLNQDFDFQFNQDNFNKNNYRKFLDKKIHDANQSSNSAIFHTVRKEYDVLFPTFHTDFHLVIPTKKIDSTGIFEDVFINENLKDLSDKILDTNPAHNYYTWNILNDPLSLIHNRSSLVHNKGKKILILQGSFGSSLTPYLATDVEYIDIIYPPGFNGSIRTYVEQTSPDLVILMYSATYIAPIDWDTYNSAFDLR